jgi:hypothetical protein
MRLDEIHTGGFYIDKYKIVHEVCNIDGLYVWYNLYDKFGNRQQQYGQGHIGDVADKQWRRHMSKWDFAQMMQMRVKKKNV